jgi:hypothetical protein
MARVKVVIFLPLADNDGRDLSAERADAEDQVFLLFGGWTRLGLVQGSYKMADGSKAVDAHEAIAVVVDEDRLDNLRDVVLGFKARTTQESIYFEVQYRTEIEFL